MGLSWIQRWNSVFPKLLDHHCYLASEVSRRPLQWQEPKILFRRFQNVFAGWLLSAQSSRPWPRGELPQLSTEVICPVVVRLVAAEVFLPGSRRGLPIQKARFQIEVSLSLRLRVSVGAG